ncbi:MAG: DUF4198 domain-containing protein [Gemmatimonadaceae bacterium]|nr:DUF4198 domain-containing protein [Gemmatimonadaceae bacterium]
MRFPVLLHVRHMHIGQRRALVAGTALVGLLIVTATASAHDFWLVPNAFAIPRGGDLVIRGQTSSLFPTSGSAVAPARVAEANLVGAGGSTAIRNLSTSGSSLVLQHRPAAAGQYVVAVRLAPISVRESPASFRRYLELEGAPEALARYAREGRLPTDSITRRYAKYAKTFVEVGRDGARAHATAVGHPTELMPLSDPAALRVGDTLRVRFTFQGTGVSEAHLHAGAVPLAASLAASRADTTAARAASKRDLSLTTDAAGIASVVIDRPGTWNVRNIHILPAAANSGADWDVHWSTMVFQVRDDVAPTAGRAAAAPSDSAGALRAVEQYHRALQAGDSAAALMLLAPDVMILESGGVETRSEYRGHHLPGDIAFARAVPSVRTVRQVVVHGATAWVTSTSVTQGTYNGRAINSQGAELIVLTQDAEGRWLIRAIHWSSRARRGS